MQATHLVEVNMPAIAARLPQETLGLPGWIYIYRDDTGQLIWEFVFDDGTNTSYPVRIGHCENPF